jgi:hypothetical protein
MLSAAALTCAQTYSDAAGVLEEFDARSFERGSDSNRSFGAASHSAISRLQTTNGRLRHS